MSAAAETSTVMVTEKELKSQDFTKFTASTKSVAAFWQQMANALKVHSSTDVLEAIEKAIAGRKKSPMEDQIPALASEAYKAWADPQSTDAAVKRRGRVLSHLYDKMCKAMSGDNTYLDIFGMSHFANCVGTCAVHLLTKFPGATHSELTRKTETMKPEGMAHIESQDSDKTIHDQVVRLCDKLQNDYLFYEIAIEKDEGGKSRKLAIADVCTTMLERVNEVQAIQSDSVFQKAAKAAIRGKDPTDPTFTKNKELDVMAFLDWIMTEDESREHEEGGAMLTTQGHTRTWVPGAEPRAGDSVKVPQDKQALRK